MRTETILQVLIASPSDVSEERDLLSQAIEELNSLWAPKLGVRLELVRWESHAYPSFGEDAQDVINKQLPSEYDLFMGLLWARFGTPTARAASGTIEEFERALAQYRRQPESTQLMIYFKDAAKPLSEIDPTQLAAVNDFKKRVEDEGGLHWTFRTADEFTASVRIHLARFLQDWQERNRDRSSTSGDTALAARDEPPRTETADDEVGFFDALEVAMDSVAAVTQTLERMTAYSTELSESITARVAENTELQKTGNPSSPAAFKRLANRLADDMEQYVRRTKLETVELERQLKELLSSTSSVATLSLDFGLNVEHQSQLTLLANQVESFGKIIAGNAESALELRETVLAAPRMTITFNRAKRATGEVLADVARITEDAGKSCLTVAAGIREIVGGGRGPDESPSG